MRKYKVKLLKRVLNGKTWFSTYQRRYISKGVAKAHISRARKQQKAIRKGIRMRFRLLKSGKKWFVFYR